MLDDQDMGSMAKEEIESLEKQKQALLESAQPKESPDGDSELKTRGAILEIRGAAGRRST